MVEVGPVVGPWGAPQAEVASETSAAALPSRRVSLCLLEGESFTPRPMCLNCGWVMSLWLCEKSRTLRMNVRDAIECV